MAKSTSSRRQQTRLAFAPMSSSSPAAKGYNQQIRDRAAAVRLEGSPSPAKRRKRHDSSVDEDDVNEDESVWPTPAATAESRAVRKSHDSDSEPVRSTQRRQSGQNHARFQAKQRQIDFSLARDPSSFDSPVKITSSSLHQSSGTGMFSSQAHRQPISISSDDSEDSEHLPSPAKVISESRSKRRKDDKAKEETMVGRSTSGISRKPIIIDSETDEVVVHDHRADQGQNRSEDEDMPTMMGTQRRGRRKAATGRVQFSSPQPLESDDEVVITGEPKVKRAKRTAAVSDESEDDLEPSTPRARKSNKLSRRMSQQEKNDLEEDLEFLGPSSDVDFSARTPRDSKTSSKNARLNALEKLKRMRKGKEANPQDENKSQDGEDTDAHEPDEYEADDMTVSENVSSRRMFEEDEDDQGFLTDEGDASLGAPDGIPLEFTRYASMKPKELFKYAVEWMVQKKINPAFEGTDPLYDLTFKKLDDEVKGLAGSKFTSSAWTLPFTMALQNRPDIAYESIDRNSAEHFFRDKCDACNRGSHPATFQIQFQGKPYYRETLEEIADDNDDDSSTSGMNNNDEDQPSYDAQGREVPAESTIFYVGKFCMSNAQTAHALRHWRYHLNEWVVTWLIKEGYCKPERLVERDQWSTKKRRKYANKIVDRMDRDGHVRTLWKDFRGNIDEARTSKQHGRYVDSSP